MNLKAIEVDGEIHGVKVDDAGKIVKDYGVVVRQPHCPCQCGAAHLVKGPVFFLDMQREFRTIPWKGIVDIVVHEGVYCLPENVNKFWCSQFHSV